MKRVIFLVQNGQNEFEIVESKKQKESIHPCHKTDCPFSVEIEK
jgi:hypothetical protein